MLFLGGPSYAHIVSATNTGVAITVQGSNLVTADIATQNEALLFDVSELKDGVSGMIYHKSTGLVANVNGGFTTEGTEVIVYEKVPDYAGETWTYRDGRIYSALTGFAMEMHSDGHIVMMPHSNDLTQLWSFKPASKSYITCQIIR